VVTVLWWVLPGPCFGACGGTPAVRAWLARNAHVTFHFTPVESSWVNQIDTWFEIITKQAIRPARSPRSTP